MPKPVTVEQTSKHWKAHLAVSCIVFWAGWYFAFTADPGSPEKLWSSWMIVGGAAWYVIAKIGSWWSNG